MPKVNLAQCMIDRTLLATGLDDAVFTSHWRGMASGGPDIFPMDHGLRQKATDRLKVFWNETAGLITSKLVFREVRWYEVDDAAPHRATYVETITPAAAPGLPGTSGGGLLPAQVATSITFKTAQRKNWGRFYLPGLTNTQYDLTTTGLLKNTVCDQLAASAKKLTDRGGLLGDATLTVWSPTEGTHHDPQSVQVDNNPDVVRRRRVKISTYKKTVAAG